MSLTVTKAMPDQFKKIGKRFYSFVPLRYRMGNEYWAIKRFLENAQWWSREEIASWQLRRFRQILKYAYKNVPGYHLMYKEAGVKPQDIQVLSDINLLPFVIKELIRDNLEDFTSRAIPKRKRIYATTGGSTGIPFGFYHAKLDSLAENAFIHLSWERAGYRFGDSSAVLRGASVGSEERPWAYDPNRKELLLSSYYLNEKTYERYLERILEYKPLHLQAYPSAATILTDLVLKKGDTGKVTFKAILLGSENIYEWQKQKIQEAFPGTKVFGWYGHSEQAILAPMCEHSEQYHIWPFYGFAEILDDKDKDVTEGETGELVGTSFWNYATPFIRYRTMDMAKKGKFGCNECGRQFQLLRNIEGRMQDYVVTKNGAYVTLTALIFAQHFKAFSTIKNMQLYQDDVGVVIVKIVPTDRFSKEDANEIKNTMEKSVGGAIKVKVKLVKDIPRTLRGKYRFLEQKLDIKYRQ